MINMFWKTGKNVPLDVGLIYVLIYMYIFLLLGCLSVCYLSLSYQIVLKLNGDLTPQKWGHRQRCGGEPDEAFIGLILDSFISRARIFRTVLFANMWRLHLLTS